MRGDRELHLPAAAAAGLAHGDWIEISVRDDEGKSLLSHLSSGDPGEIHPKNLHQAQWERRMGVMNRSR